MYHRTAAAACFLPKRWLQQSWFPSWLQPCPLGVYQRASRVFVFQSSSWRHLISGGGDNLNRIKLAEHLNIARFSTFCGATAYNIDLNPTTNSQIFLNSSRQKWNEILRICGRAPLGPRPWDRAVRQCVLLPDHPMTRALPRLKPFFSFQSLCYFVVRFLAFPFT